MASDREQITDLMTRYGWACDARDWEALRECFFPDATVEYEGFGTRHEGVEKLEAYLKEALAPLDATQHLFSNFLIRTDGDSGSFRCGMRAQHLRRDEPGGQCFMVGGTYHIDVRRADDGWRMSRMRYVPIWTEGNPSVLRHIMHEGVDTSAHATSV